VEDTHSASSDWDKPVPEISTSQAVSLRDSMAAEDRRLALCAQRQEAEEIVKYLAHVIVKMFR